MNGVLTVQTMVSKALLKWGSVEQIQKWIPLLAQGEIIGAFALTEPGGGSDIHSLATEFTRLATAELSGSERRQKMDQLWPVCIVISGVRKTGRPLAGVFGAAGKLPVSRWNPFMI